ncbi:MAG: aldehyde dehydrogenase family protein [Epsilonproteobacteria bacterium]|nr:aldehyde dehydrogenase family protein [Campylobacterota bacterium]
MSTFQTITPIDNSVYFEDKLNTQDDINRVLKEAKTAQLEWAKLSLEEKKGYIQQFIDEIVSKKDEIARGITLQMGRPVSQSIFEVNGFKERAEYMLNLADESLEPYYPKQIDGFERKIIKEPLGVICLISPWNYPFLTSVNVLIPALLAGNSVILRHSLQTPLVAKQYKEAFQRAGLPESVFDILYLNHEDSAVLLADKRVDGVFFTGSVGGGIAVQDAIKEKFIPCGLELGGKDPAYVRADADLDYSVGNLVDGSFFNSGQSCCGIERIYVDEKIYDDFIEKFVKLTKQYKLGDPLMSDVNLGPMVKISASEFVRKQIKEAIDGGAKSLVDEKLFPASKKGTPYLAPTVLVNVNHSMSVMNEESFGPVVGIMKVKSDEEAITLMNDSLYGLTASIWTKDIKKAEELSTQIETGTVFMNRCDYLDPGLAWTGVKDTGRGISLSTFGFEQVTRVKSIHFKII